MCVPPERIIPVDEERKKRAEAFYALEYLNTYWDGKLHDGFWVTSEGISTSAENSYNNYTTL